MKRRLLDPNQLYDHEGNPEDGPVRYVDVEVDPAYISKELAGQLGCRPSRLNNCRRCRKDFFPKSPRTYVCPDCKTRIAREQAARMARNASGGMFVSATPQVVA